MSSSYERLGAPDRLVELIAINRAMAAATDYDTLLRIVVERSASLLDATVALILERTDGDSRIAASIGIDAARARSFRTTIDDGVGRRISDFITCAHDRFLSVPIVESGEVRGVLGVCRHSEAFDESDASMLSALADQAAIAMGNVRTLRSLQDAVRALKEADQRKDEFLGMLSHELRNPLAPIRTAIYLLTRVDQHSEPAARARVVIQRQTDHLTRLIDDLLDVTRIARGKITLKRERMNVVDVIRRSADDHRSLLSDHGIAFNVDLPAKDVWMEADPTRIAQVVGNLLQNAAKFTPAGGSVILRVRPRGSKIDIAVRDNGSGIDPSLVDRIFEPFVQSDRSLARTEGGLGLGLALVKGVVELHGGTVRASSEGLGHGAEFIVSLPIVAAQHADRLEPLHTPPTTDSRRVLVIDDNRDAAESLAELVSLFGHSVDVAFDGPSALALVRRLHPDVVLCDVGLPGMDGYDVARAIRASDESHIRLIAVSGYAQPEDVRKAADAGFDAHLAKPADPAAIDRLLA